MRKALSTSTVVFALAAIGCVDPQGAFNDFAGRVVDAPVTFGTNFCDSATVPDVTGEFLLAVRPGAAPSSVAQFITTMSMDSGTLGLSAIPLKLADRTPTAGPPLDNGNPIPLGQPSVPLSGDGAYTMQFNGFLPGDSNPVIPGSAAELNAEMQGDLCRTDFFCGTLSGQAGSLELSGTTFAAIRVAPGTIGAALPAPVTECEAPAGIDAGVDAL